MSNQQYECASCAATIFERQSFVRISSSGEREAYVRYVCRGCGVTYEGTGKMRAMNVPMPAPETMLVEEYARPT